MEITPPNNTRFIFVTGGVVSSLGKGVTAASIGTLLQAHGYKVRIRKLDPYLNVDAGTLSPFEHGEVYVTDDGAETDLDLGHYERFTGVTATRNDNVTSGRIYQNIINKERQGDVYHGATVQVVPHVINEIKQFITGNLDEEDFIICEIGGTVGDIESLPFLEAIRQVGNDIRRSRCLFVHVTLLPYIAAADELKTKPSQHSVKEILSLGIQPDMLVCRTEHDIPARQKRKLALFCNMPENRLISAKDLDTIYACPEALSKEGLDREILGYFTLGSNENSYDRLMGKWQKIVTAIREPGGVVNIACVGKYIDLSDAYKSLIAALEHGGIANGVKVNIVWVDSESIENLSVDKLRNKFIDMHGILVPGGFGDRGSEGKIATAKFAREQNIPYFGICFGMQMAVIEFARHIAGIKNAHSMEFMIDLPNPQDYVPIITHMTQWQKGEAVETRKANSDWGGTMRLGAYACMLKQGSLVGGIYGHNEMSERHRHRYEVDIAYREQLEQAGMVFSGLSPDGKLPEIIEIPSHSWFVGVQFHPELQSRPSRPHPLFASFVKAALKQSRIV